MHTELAKINQPMEEANLFFKINNTIVLVLYTVTNKERCVRNTNCKNLKTCMLFLLVFLLYESIVCSQVRIKSPKLKKLIKYEQLLENSRRPTSTNLFSLIEKYIEQLDLQQLQFEHNRSQLHVKVGFARPGRER